MPTPRKESTVAELNELLMKSKSIVFTDYRGMKMKDVDTLRAKLRPQSVVFKVIKNTLFKRAAEGTPFAEVADLLDGPTAGAFGLDDSIAPARLIADYVRESRGLITVKSGVVDGQPYSAEQIAVIAKLPGRDMLVAQLIGGLQAPVAGLAGTLQMIVGSLVWTLQSIADQKA